MTVFSKKDLLRILIHDDDDNIDDSSAYVENRANSDTIPLKEATVSMYIANPFAFQDEIVDTMLKGCASDIDDSLKDFIQGGLIRDSTRLHKTKAVPKILREEFNGNDSFSLLWESLRGSLTSMNSSPAATDRRCGNINPSELSSVLIKVSNGDLTDLNDSLVDYVVGGCIRDSGKLEKTKMCPKFGGVRKEDDRRYVRSIMHPHRRGKRRGYSDENKP
mmetsp:Transcript_16504/g.34684  ORF Transcript_16504/g.34684 Transcript_16504/m.34684 type:complete len:219 (-) Transcript_16504:140-796(-)